ncbi:MAG: hypothetical protein MHM6MM_005355 [Cercozoa sp. M6MM]
MARKRGKKSSKAARAATPATDQHVAKSGSVHAEARYDVAAVLAAEAKVNPNVVIRRVQKLETELQRPNQKTNKIDKMFAEQFARFGPHPLLLAFRAHARYFRNPRDRVGARKDAMLCAQAAVQGVKELQLLRAAHDVLAKLGERQAVVDLCAANVKQSPTLQSQVSLFYALVLADEFARAGKVADAILKISTDEKQVAWKLFTLTRQYVENMRDERKEKLLRTFLWKSLAKIDATHSQFENAVYLVVDAFCRSLNKDALVESCEFLENNRGENERLLRLLYRVLQHRMRVDDSEETRAALFSTCRSLACLCKEDIAPLQTLVFLGESVDESILEQHKCHRNVRIVRLMLAVQSNDTEERNRVLREIVQHSAHKASCYSDIAFALSDGIAADDLVSDDTARVSGTRAKLTAHAILASDSIDDDLIDRTVSQWTEYIKSSDEGVDTGALNLCAALLLIKANKHAEAQTLLRTALEKTPNDTQLRLLLLRSLCATVGVAAALCEFERLDVRSVLLESLSPLVLFDAVEQCEHHVLLSLHERLEQYHAQHRLESSEFRCAALREGHVHKASEFVDFANRLFASRSMCVLRCVRQWIDTFEPNVALDKGEFAPAGGKVERPVEEDAEDMRERWRFEKYGEKALKKLDDALENTSDTSQLWSHCENSRVVRVLESSHIALERVRNAALYGTAHFAFDRLASGTTLSDRMNARVSDAAVLRLVRTLRRDVLCARALLSRDLNGLRNQIDRINAEDGDSDMWHHSSGVSTAAWHLARATLQSLADKNSTALQQAVSHVSQMLSSLSLDSEPLLCHSLPVLRFVLSLAAKMTRKSLPEAEEHLVPLVQALQSLELVEGVVGDTGLDGFDQETVRLARAHRAEKTAAFLEALRADF